MPSSARKKKSRAAAAGAGAGRRPSSYRTCLLRPLLQDGPQRHCFLFNDAATTEIYTLSLHDALPILSVTLPGETATLPDQSVASLSSRPKRTRSEEHTSELQSRPHLVCRLLLEK